METNHNTHPDPPQALEPRPEHIPATLAALPQWVCWRYDVRGEKWTKVPIEAATGNDAKTTDSATWCSFEDAVAIYRACQEDGLAGVGFVFARDGGLAGVDLDKCRDPDTGELAGWAVLVLRLLNSYSEVSPSGRGVKVWVRGSLPLPGDRSGKRRTVSEIPKLAELAPGAAGEIEAYNHSRYFAATGHRLDLVDGQPLPAEPQERSKELAALYQLCFAGGDRPAPDVPAPSGAAPAPEVVPNNLTGEEILAKATAAKNGDKFRLLWEGKWEEAGYVSPSEANLALCGLLAFWTGRDAAKMDRLFRQSGLMRDKWDSGRGGETWGDQTIALAIEECEQVYKEGKAGKKDDDKPGPVETLIDLGVTGAELFFTPDDRRPYAWVASVDHPEALAIDSGAYRTWLTGRYYCMSGRAPKEQWLNEAIATLTAKALFDGPCRPVYLRIGSHEGRIYLDLGNEQREVVEIGPDGWRLVTDPPVRFRRPRGMKALPAPQRGGSIKDLRPFVNVAGDDDFLLLVAFLLMAFHPTGPYPVLLVTGEHGAAKTTTCIVIRDLVDPSMAPLRKEPKEARDLWIAARNGWLLAWDNLSYIEQWLSDNFCALSTGGGFSTRQLYTDDEEAIFYARRPLLLNSITEIVTRADLLDRTIILTCPVISEGSRRTDADGRRAFEEARPRILGALLDGVACALANRDKVDLEGLPRLADFAVWATAAETALGWPEGAFMDAYWANINAANDVALEGDIIVPHLRRLLEGKKGWPERPDDVKTAEDLLQELTRLAGGTMKIARLEGWPKRPRDLSGRLRRLAPVLRRIGIDIQFGTRETTGERRRPVRIVVAGR
jgi:hypothetical protein